MAKRVLRPPNLSFQPRPTYPYSPGTHGGDYVYTAGQVAWNDKGEIVGVGDVRAQTQQVLSNIRSILHEAGASMADVLKCNVYLADIRDFQAMNEEFAKGLPDRSARADHRPGSARGEGDAGGDRGHCLSREMTAPLR